MTLYRLEFKKLISSSALWGFIAICLLFNILLSLNPDNSYENFVAKTSKDTGYVLDHSFNEKLSEITVCSEEAEYLEQLKSETLSINDVFDGYKTDETGERYIDAGKATGRFAESIRNKYSSLQKVVDEKAAKDESLTLYFAGGTYSRHQQLFNSAMGWLIIEGVLISSLLSFLSVEYEHTSKTEGIVYSTKTGRSIMFTKIGASISAGLLSYLILAVVTLLIYFGINSYGNIWGSNVSSAFNYRYDIIAGYRPFITWHSFSVFSYLEAMLTAGAGLIICFSLMAFATGLLIKNNYIGFLVFMVANTAMTVLPFYTPDTMPMLSQYIRYYSMLSPVWLWLKHGLWFTDGDMDIMWPHFETLGICISMLVLFIFYMCAATYFKRKDIA